MTPTNRVKVILTGYERLPYALLLDGESIAWFAEWDDAMNVARRVATSVYLSARLG